MHHQQQHTTEKLRHYIYSTGARQDIGRFRDCMNETHSEFFETQANKLLQVYLILDFPCS